MKSTPRLILASTSVYRRQLLFRLGIPFECEAPGTDETPQSGEPALALVGRLARAKARTVAQRHPDACVVGSDQVAFLEDDGRPARIIGKPGSTEQCMADLLGCSGRTLAFVTAVAVIRGGDLSVSEFIDTTLVQFRTLDRGTVERYVARENPLDCAGGFKSEGLGISLCESIESRDPTALIGLPLIGLGKALRAVGFELP